MSFAAALVRAIRRKKSKIGLRFARIACPVLLQCGVQADVLAIPAKQSSCAESSRKFLRPAKKSG
ncbi:MAG: hypothetical protein J1E07_09550 [Treponema sp.]|nr:hypothetical protein [Treponema sp.]